jgi:hypothetical protein
MLRDAFLPMLGIGYACVAYYCFWQVVFRIGKDDIFSRRAETILALLALIVGPPIYAGTLLFMALLPKRRPKRVVFLEMNYDPATKQVSQTGEYETVWWTSDEIDAGEHRVSAQSLR